MIIDNAKTIVKYRLLSLALSVVFLFLLLTLLTPVLVKKEIFGISKDYFSITIGSLYVMYNLYVILMNRNYFYFSDETDKLEFKYYSTLPFSSNKNYVAISKNNFDKYEIVSSMGGLKPKLILYQKSGRGGVAKYKPIILSALKKNEIENLENSLKSFSSNK